MSDNLIKNIVQESAAKPNELTTHQEGSETIPSGSTPLDSNNGGSALPLACNDEGEEIVRGNEFYKQSFINRGEKLFNSKFDYSKVKYITMRTPVEIICPEHGTFWQRPMDHLRNKFGCPMCAQKYKDKTYKGTLANKKAQIESRITKEEFLEIANKKYNNKFTYNLDNWTGLVNSEITVICPIHGAFNVLARTHIMKGNKNGCPLCGNKMRALHKSFTYDQIIGMCKEKYGDYYTYPESNRDFYKTKQSKIQIICPKHGMFEKRVQKFLGADQECPKCKIERTILNGYVPGGYNHDWFNKHPDQKSHTGILYYLKVIDKTNNQILYKIGISKKETPKYRIRSLRSSALRNSNIVLDIEILHYKQYELYTAFCLEQKILQEYKDIRKYTTYSSELFTDNIYEHIKQYF